VSVKGGGNVYCHTAMTGLEPGLSGVPDSSFTMQLIVSVCVHVLNNLSPCYCHPYIRRPIPTVHAVSLNQPRNKQNFHF